jgi:hypothetical protein
MENWAQAYLEGTGKLHDLMVQTSWNLSLPLCCLSLSLYLLAKGISTSLEVVKKEIKPTFLAH